MLDSAYAAGNRCPQQTVDNKRRVFRIVYERFGGVTFDMDPRGDPLVLIIGAGVELERRVTGPIRMRSAQSFGLLEQGSLATRVVYLQVP